MPAVLLEAGGRSMCRQSGRVLADYLGAGLAARRGALGGALAPNPHFSDASNSFAAAITAAEEERGVPASGLGSPAGAGPGRGKAGQAWPITPHGNSLSDMMTR